MFMDVAPESLARALPHLVAVEEDAFRSADEGRGGSEEIWVEKWVNDGFPEGRDDRF
jgi:hypothetical protein